MADRRERTGTELSPLSGCEQLTVGLASDPRRPATGPTRAMRIAASWTTTLRRATGLLVQTPNATAPARMPRPVRGGACGRSDRLLLRRSSPGGVEPLRSDQHGRASLGGHHAVVSIPVVVCAARG